MSSPHTATAIVRGSTQRDRAGTSTAELATMIEISWNRLVSLCSTAMAVVRGNVPIPV